MTFLLLLNEGIFFILFILFFIYKEKIMTIEYFLLPSYLKQSIGKYTAKVKEKDSLELSADCRKNDRQRNF